MKKFTDSGIEINEVYAAGDLPAGDHEYLANFLLRVAYSLICTVVSYGPCASTQALVPPKKATSVIITCCRRALTA